MTHETRSDIDAGAQMSLFEGLPASPGPAPTPSAPRGVGARQARPAPPQGGGGYLDGCNAPELPADPRFRELAEIGLSAVWLAVAQRVGYDRFMDLWRMLSADESVQTDDRQIVLRIRDFSRYELLQRDLYIRRLVALGLPPAEIPGMVHLHLGDQSSAKAIKAVAKASWAARRSAIYSPAVLSPYLIERMRQTAHSDASPDMFPAALEHALMAEACKAAQATHRHADQADPRLAELADIGLMPIWTRFAGLVGYDAFVALWRSWSRNPALRGNYNLIELRLRHVRSFERYQRNRYIETLVAAGLKPSEIHAMVRTELGENMSFRHLKRLTAAVKVPT